MIIIIKLYEDRGVGVYTLSRASAYNHIGLTTSCVNIRDGPTRFFSPFLLFDYLAGPILNGPNQAANASPLFIFDSLTPGLLYWAEVFFS